MYFFFMSEFDLKELQDAVIGVPNDVTLPPSQVNIARDERLQSMRKIVDIYSICRKNNRVYKSTYLSLVDDSPYVRVAAADMIGESGNINSFEYLFNALEDEDVPHVRQSIVNAIDKLEGKLSNSTETRKESNLMKSMRILSFQP